MTQDTRPPGLIQRYREALQVRHYARRTVSTYEQWLRRYLRFHRLRHVGTTMIYTPVLNRGPLGVRSPANIL